MPNHGSDAAIHLLVVDSDPETAAAVRKSLRGYPGVTLAGVATTGSQAFELAAELQPDLILVDPDLPESDGIFLLPAVLWPVEPAVVLLSSTARSTSPAASRTGAHGMIPKPVRVEDLISVLDDVRYSPGMDRALGQHQPASPWETIRRREQWITLPFLRRWTRAGMRRARAEEAARKLLNSHLTDEEQQQLAAHGYLEVQSPGRNERRYRIPADGGRVHVLEHGRVTLLLCLEPTESLPRSDLVLLHKLLLQADEEAYLQTANQFTPSGQSLHRRQP